MACGIRQRGRRPARVSLGAEFLERRTLLSAGPAPAIRTQILDDINTNGAGLTVSSHVTSLANVDGILYFDANDGSTGTELWKSDGTAAGTVLVADIAPGSASSTPQDLTAIGGKLYFLADDGTHGTQVFVSDGTAAGTVELTNIAFGGGGKASAGTVTITDLNGTACFNAPTALWRSDGTVAGTVLVKTFTGRLVSLTTVNNTLFFVASDATNINAIWSSDGTAAGTTILNVPTGGRGASELTDVAGTLFFSVSAAPNTELWKSDGSAAGTVLVKTLISVGGRGAVSSPAVVGDTLYFSFDDGTNGKELWKSDGTDAGTMMVADIVPGATGSNPTALVGVGNTLFFTTGGLRLWKSDGTAAGTIALSAANADPFDLTNVGGTLYFEASDITNGAELWKSDGTPGGTVLVKDIAAGNNGSSPASITAIGNKAFFSADDFIHGRELWSSDGTAAGTAMVTNIYPATAGSSPTQLTAAGNRLFFVANDGVHGNELWSSDGTAAGTALMADINPGTLDANIQSPTNVNGTLFFSATGPARGLFRSDGTPTGTIRLSTSSTSGPNSLTAVNGVLYYIDLVGSDWELFKSDGTPAGTGVFKTFTGGGLLPDQTMVNVGGKLFFVGRDLAHGNELWTSDGTAAGTVLVADLTPGAAGSSLQNLTAVGNTLYFTFDDGTHGKELWKSDGTAAGTMMVADIAPGSASALNSAQANLLAVGNKLFFIATDGTHGNQIWVTDGTAAGTQMLSNFNINADPVIDFLTNVNGTVFFKGGELFGTTGIELWKTDGTVAGTQIVSDIVSGEGSSLPAQLTSVGGMLCFTVEAQVWQSDGTAAGTVPISPRLVTLSRSLTAVGNNLFFAGDDGLFGAEVQKAASLNAAYVAADPQSQTLTVGADVAFSAYATGVPAPTVAWFVEPAGSGTFQPIPGATSPSLDLGPATLAENGNQYRAVFTNSAGPATTAAATLTVVPPAVAPQVTLSPQTQTVAVGADVTFTAAATGTPTPTVQWYVETSGSGTFVAIGGATATTLDIGPTTLDESGNQYEAIFTNSAGPATTASATLTVNPAAPVPSKLAFGQQPTAANANAVLTPAVTVLVEDASNNVVTGDNSQVTIQLGSGLAGETLAGTLTVTAVNGVATFSNLSLNVAGTCTLQAIDGALTAATSHTFTIGATTGTISGRLFNDANANGHLDASESFRAFQGVFLDANNNGQRDANETSVQTDATGHYQFDAVAPGVQLVRPVPTPGTRFSNTTIQTPAITAGSVLANWNLGVTTLAMLSGTVFNDTNHDGRMEAGETGRAGVKVFLDQNNDGIPDHGEKSVLTDSKGQFSFGALVAGTYRLRVVVPAHNTVTTPRGGVYVTKLTAGQVVSGKLFGLKH